MVGVIRVAAVAAAFVVAGVVGAASGAVQALSAQAGVPADTFTGTWKPPHPASDCRAAFLDLTQTGSTVDGLFGPCIPGRVSGTRNGNVLTASWSFNKPPPGACSGGSETYTLDGRLLHVHEICHATGASLYYDWYCAAGPCLQNGHVLTGPVKITIDFHATQRTAPPSDGGRCPTSPVPIVTARVTGQIEAQITPTDDHQGGGYVTDTPVPAVCRVPRIKFAVDHIAVVALTPGKVIQATLSVHIDGEAVHQPGQCKVGTTGTIVATYDDTLTAANSLPNHRLLIGGWSGPCNADMHVITNNISSITAGSAGSSYVHVWIGCLLKTYSGYSPRNCGV